MTAPAQFAEFFEKNFSQFSNGFWNGNSYSSQYSVPLPLIAELNKTKKKKNKKKKQKPEEGCAEEEKKGAAEQERIKQAILDLLENYLKTKYGEKPLPLAVTSECQYREPTNDYVLNVKYPAKISGRMQPDVLKKLRQIHASHQRDKLRETLNTAYQQIVENYFFNILAPKKNVRLIEISQISSLSWHEIEHEIRDWFEKYHELPTGLLKVFMSEKNDAILLSVCEKWRQSLVGDEEEGTGEFM